MIKVALIGCGRIAERHANILNSEIKNAKLVSVCDTEELKAKQFGMEYKVPYYTEIEKMMTSEIVDLAVVLTPSGLHAEHTIKLSGLVKNILVEKPMSLKVEDADKMITECKKNNCELFIVKQNRYNLPVQKLRSAINKKLFGKLILGTVRVRWARHQKYYDQDDWRGTWKFDGGVLTNQASHHIDMLIWMMGDVESVFAKSSTALVNIETEDTAIVSIKFKNGALGIIEATTATRPDNLEGSISILGEKGTVVIGGFAVNKMEVWKFVDNSEEDISVMEQYSENPPDVYGFGHRSFYEAVLDSIINNKANPVDGIEGRKTVDVINAIYESIETNKEVFIDKPRTITKLGN